MQITYPLLLVPAHPNVNEGRIIIRLVPKSQRDKSQKEIIDRLREQLRNISGTVQFQIRPIVGSGR